MNSYSVPTDDMSLVREILYRDSDYGGPIDIVV